MIAIAIIIYTLIGFTQIPVLERQVTRSIQDMPYRTPLFLKMMAWILAMLFAIAIEPLFSFAFYITKPWTRK